MSCDTFLILCSDRCLKAQASIRQIATIYGVFAPSVSPSLLTITMSTNDRSPGPETKQTYSSRALAWGGMFPLFPKACPPLTPR